MKKLFNIILCIICSIFIGLYYPMFAAQKASDQSTNLGTLIPTGTILPYAGSTAPSGWVLAYGQEVSQTGTYAKLYAALSTTYCTTDHGGTCTGGNFRIPDLRGRSLAGKDNMGGSAASRITSAKTIDGTVLGKAGGSQSFTPAGSNNSSSVPALGLSFSGSGTSYTVSVPSHYHNSFSLTAAGQTYGTSNVVSSDPGGHTHGMYKIAFPVGSGAGYNLVNQTDISQGTVQTGSAGGHTHTTNIAHSHSASSVSGSVGNQGGNNGDAAFNASGTNTPSGSIGGTATAAGQAFTGTEGNNLMPTVIINYIIKI